MPRSIMCHLHSQRLGCSAKFARTKGGHAQVIRTRQVVHIDDLRAQQPYIEGDPAVTAIVDLGGARTIVLVPMLREDD